MISLHKRKERHPLALWIVLALVILCLLVFLFNRALLARPIAFVFTPLQREGAAVFPSISRFVEGFREKQSLLDDIAQLTKERDDARTLLYDRQALADENTELKKMLGRSTSHTSIVASVLERPPVSPYDTLLIDAGESEGVALGDSVVSGPFRIGTVESVFGHSAKVKLLSSPGETTNVLIGSTKIVAEAIGKGGGNFEADIPRDISVSVGDVVSLPGLFGSHTGVVDAVTVRPTDTLQSISFRLPLNLFELSLVEVVH